MLNDILVQIPRGGLTLVTGKVASGKSLLLASILGEACVQSGTLEKPHVGSKPGPKSATDLVSGATAFVSQPPWIEHTSIRDNIVFGQPWDKSRYEKVIKACALTHDLEILAEGDLTSAGPAGSSLSGGQKWRVALARALYSPAEIVLLDDILSAVDAPIARFICEHTLKNELQSGRTIILATNHAEYCSGLLRYQISLENGSATVKSLPIATQSQLVTEDIMSGDIENTEGSESAEGREKDVEKNPSTESPGATNVPKSATTSYWTTLARYLQIMESHKPYVLGVMVVLFQRFMSAGHSWWLAEWTSDDSGRFTLFQGIAIYLLLSVSSITLQSVQTQMFTRIGHTSSQLLFDKLMGRVMNAKLSWIDTTPPGQVIQMLNTDMYAINHRIAPQIIGLLGSIIHIMFICITRYEYSHCSAVSTNTAR